MGLSLGKITDAIAAKRMEKEARNATIKGAREQNQTKHATNHDANVVHRTGNVPSHYQHQSDHTPSPAAYSNGPASNVVTRKRPGDIDDRGDR